MEATLKLLIQPADVAALKEHPLLARQANEGPKAQEQFALYFDTPDLCIRRAHAHLRVRQAEGEWRQTFKVDISALAGLQQRQEWESPVDGPRPDLGRLCAELAARPFCQDLLATELQPLFSAQFTRTVWRLRLPQGDEVEAALDQGNLECGEQSVPINELELELLSGRPECLFDLALTLLESLPLQLDSRSKPDRGYALLAPQLSMAAKAQPVDLAPKMPLEQAFQVILRNCLNQVQANEPGVAHGQSPDNLHQMRVGLRRLRSALRLFEKIMPCPEELQQGLGDLAAQLGKARDWDVLLDSTLPWVAQATGGAPQVSAIHLVASDKARLCHEAASAALQAPRYSQLMLSFGAWVEGASWRLSPRTQAQRLDKPLAPFAEQRLRQAQKRLLKRGKALKKADTDARHRLRIAAKRLRYACEFFRALYPKKPMKAYTQALSSLQDRLGRLNDAAVAIDLLHELQHEHRPLREAVACVEACLDSLAQGELDKLRKRWRQLRGRDLPRRKGASG